jgi:hypothetical protein
MGDKLEYIGNIWSSHGLPHLQHLEEVANLFRLESWYTLTIQNRQYVRRRITPKMSVEPLYDAKHVNPETQQEGMSHHWVNKEVMQEL